MAVIFLVFARNPAPEEFVILVTEALSRISPNLTVSERTEDTITFTSPVLQTIEIYHDIVESWFHSDPPIITTSRMTASPPLLLPRL